MWAWLLESTLPSISNPNWLYYSVVVHSCCHVVIRVLIRFYSLHPSIIIIVSRIKDDIRNQFNHFLFFLINCKVRAEWSIHMTHHQQSSISKENIRKKGTRVKICVDTVTSLESLLKTIIFWVVVRCSLVEVYQCLRGACCLHHHGPDDGGSKHQ